MPNRHIFHGIFRGTSGRNETKINQNEFSVQNSVYLAFCLLVFHHKAHYEYADSLVPYMAFINYEPYDPTFYLRGFLAPNIIKSFFNKKIV